MERHCTIHPFMDGAPTIFLMKGKTRFFICLLGLLAAFLLIAGCTGAAPTAGDGDTVKVNFIASSLFHVGSLKSSFPSFK
ncbi:hypothetical protein KTGMC3_P1997 [Methanocalculus sp. MC3]